MCKIIDKDKIQKAQTIIEALRCSCEVRPAGASCEGCAYRVVEEIPAEYLGMVTCEKKYWESCDVESISRDAADMLEELIGGATDGKKN